MINSLLRWLATINILMLDGSYFIEVLFGGSIHDDSELTI